ncbi:hypothetical protein L6R29_12730 [Myxococcota bacterium]|nr:hypothetical protein [Myxococcota bacterium]
MMSKPWMIGWFVCVVGAASVGLVACGETGCASTNVSYAKCVQPIFARGCAGSFCHGKDQPSLGLTLTEGSPAVLVGAESKQNPGAKLVVAGKSADSYLYQKVSQDKPAAGSRMPSGTKLSDADLNLIKAWIDEGAKAN